MYTDWLKKIIISQICLLFINNTINFSFIKVTCARCNKIMSLKEYESKHKRTHYNICWLIGEEKPVRSLLSKN